MISAHPTTPTRRILIAAVFAGLLVVPAVWAQSPPGSAGAKQASKCQQTIGKANAKFLTQRLKRLAACSTGVLGCLQTSPGDAKCLAKATTKCRKQIGVPGEPDALGDAVEAAVVKTCGALAPADLFDVAALGFADSAAACAEAGVNQLTTAAELATCLRNIHAGISEQTIGAEVPRAGELTAQGGIDASLVPDLPLFEGCGDCATVPAANGKAVTGCAAAANKAGAAFVASTRAGLDKCTAAFIKCAQEKPGDAGCSTKATVTCQKLPAALAKARTKLQAALHKKCGGALPFGTLQAASGINLGALTCACKQVGVESIASVDDYGVCMARHHECELAALLPTVAPGLDALLAAQNLAVSDLLCATPTPPAPITALAAGAHAFTSPFGTIKKFMSGVFPAQLKTTKSPLATRGLRPRVGAPFSAKCGPAPGRTCTFKVPISKKPTSFKSAARGAAEPPTMVIAVRRLDGAFVDDHFELPLGDTSVDGTAEFDVTYADDLESCDFELALSVVEDGEVAPYTAIDQQPHLPPGNDSCGAAKPIDGNGFFEVVDTTAATTDVDELAPSCAPQGISRSVWYTFTPTASGLLVLGTVGGDAADVVGVFSGGCGGSEVACADLTQPGQTGVNVPVVAGTTYVVQIGLSRNLTPVTSTLYFAAGFIPGVFGSPATISNLVLGTPLVNSASCDFNEIGTAFPLSFDYSDPSGNVTPETAAALVLEHFEPSQRELFGIPTSEPQTIGDAFSGTFSTSVCAFFGSDTAISFKVNLATVGGLSNQLVGALPKPPGAN